MHTITECPRCKKDFMFHQTDYHLNRVVAWDADTKEACSFETICQDCHLKEKWIDKEVKVTEGSFYDYLNKFKLVVESVETDNSFPLTVKIGNTDSYEWFQEEELEIVEE